MDAPMTAATTVGQFDFDDGGTYRGGSDGGRAHGYGVCTGPAGQGEYAGAWREGFETSGVYQWPPSSSGSSGAEYSGQWMQGKRHGLGVERRGRWTYRGEWTQGAMGRYGVRQCTAEGSHSKYEGTWTGGLQDGYGLETYSDTGTYQGQWMKGARHGYGVRKSAVYSSAAPCRPNSGTGSQSPASSGHHLRSSSLTSVRSELLPDAAGGSSTQQISPSTGSTKGRPASSPQHHHHNQSTEHYYPVAARMGFFLTGRCLELDSSELNRHGSFLARQLPASLRASFSGGRSSAMGSTDRKRRGSAGEVGIDVGDLESSRGSSHHRHHHHHQQQQQLLAGTSRVVDTTPTDETASELYSGEWKNDRRSGFGVCERSDGLKYEGEWLDDCKNGYGVTTFNGGPDNPGGWREEGKYRNNVLITSGKRLLAILPPVVRSSKQRERIDAAVAAAVRAAQIAVQKSDIANSRMESARSKAELADQAAAKAKADADRAKMVARDVEQKERLTAADMRQTSMALTRDDPRQGADQYQRPSGRPPSAPDGMPRESQNPSTSRIVQQQQMLMMLQQQQQQQQQQQDNRQPEYSRSAAYTQQRRSSTEQMNVDRRNYANEDGGSREMDDGYASTGDAVGDRLIFRDNSLHGQRMRSRGGGGGRDDVDGAGRHLYNHHHQQQHISNSDYSASNSRRVSPAPSTSSLQQQRGRHDYSTMNHIDASGATASGLRFRSPVEAETYADDLTGNMANQVDGSHQNQTDNVNGTDQEMADGDVSRGLVASRPSLRLRRDFKCPNLVIFNKNSSVTNLAKPSAGGASQRQQTAADGSFAGGSQDNVPTAANGFASFGSTATNSVSTAASTSYVRLPKRRLTLPGIVKYPAPDGPVRSRSSSASSTGRTPTPLVIPEKPAETEFNDGLSVRGGRPVTEMYIVENGTRKLLEEFEIQLPVAPATNRMEFLRVAPMKANGVVTGSRSSLTAGSVNHVLPTAGSNSLSNTLPTLPRQRSTLAVASPDGLDPPKPITKRYKVAESVAEPGTSRRWAGGRRDLLGSLPDLTAIQRLQQPTPIPRVEAQLLSQQKREEIQMLFEIEQERRRRALVLRLGDFKDWVWTRQLTLALIAFNVALATAFFRLLSG